MTARTFIFRSTLTLFALGLFGTAYADEAVPQCQALPVEGNGGPPCTAWCSNAPTENGQGWGYSTDGTHCVQAAWRDYILANQGKPGVPNCQRGDLIVDLGNHLECVDQRKRRNPFQCDDRILRPEPSWSRTYRRQGRCYNWRHASCRDCGSVKKVEIPKHRSGNSKCSADFILQRRADGCSGGASGDRKRFQAACNEHDACYATPGTTQKQCDDDMYDNTNSICRRTGVLTCAHSSLAFYSAVRMGGKKSYDGGQEWGKKNCK